MSYEIYTDYDSGNNALPVLYNDKAIGAGTRMLLDALDPNCYPGSVLPVTGLAAGASLNNLVNDLPEIKVGSIALAALGTAGLKFNGTSAQALKMPARAKLDMNSVTHFGVSIWLKPAAKTIASGWDSPASHFSSPSPAGTAWYIQRNFSNPTRYVCAVAASTGVVDVAQDELAWIFIDAYIDNVAKTSRIDLYKNGLLAVTGASVALPVGWNPAIANDVILGSNPAYAGFWAGQIARFSIEDFTAVGAKTVAQFVADEQGQGTGRFS